MRPHANNNKFKEMIKNRIISCIKNAVPENISVDVVLQEQNSEKFGHYATNVTFDLAKIRGKTPIQIGEEIRAEILKSKEAEIFKNIEIAPPGFLNFWLQPNVIQEELKLIIRDGDLYGVNDLGKGKKARVEYVSANPTGPIHIGNARGGPYGEVLSKIFEKSGYEVLREYLHNDEGSQIQKLGATTWYWYKKECGEDVSFPEDGYGGEYLKEVAHSAIEKLGRDLKDSDIQELTNFTLELIFKENLDVLKKLGITFDYIVKESKLVSSGKTSEAVMFVKSKGVTKEKEGALWFSPNDEFLEDREAVILRSNGNPTYFASDIAYHREKFESGYDLVIDIFGSNHHGHTPKLKALTKLFNFDPAKFFVLLYQFVRVKRGGEVVKMSKRAGTYITAKEVLDEVGKDAMIFSFLMNSPSTHIDFDLETVKEQSMSNPVYYVQYAYVRASSIISRVGLKPSDDNLSLLSSAEDELLARRLLQFPEIIKQTACDFEVHRLTRYATELARAFHNFYEKERVLGESEELARARLFLVWASQIVLKNLFSIIGISAPEKM